MALASLSAHADINYNSNLIVNGDAENGITGWNTYAEYSPIQSVSYGDNWVKPTEPGPVQRGASMFTGTGAYAVGMQTLDFGLTSTQATFFTLSGWLGGWKEQGDNASLSVAFYGDTNQSQMLSQALIGPVTPADRNNQTGLLYREQTGWMPAGTRSVGFWLSMERQVSNDNDGYADNLSFVLDPSVSPVPEPQSLAMCLAGLGLIWVRRKKVKTSA